jgi:pimeloyl-ACP methyl ester carboxylesterase
MPDVFSGGVRINYTVDGQGPPIVLVHGFAASIELNWRLPGIIDALAGAGRRVIAVDCRGHGQSEKPHDPEAYSGTRMADDVIAVMDHLGVDKADLMGYSMGGFLSASLLVRHPERFNSVILSGVGDGLLLGAMPRERSEAIARAMEADGAAKPRPPGIRGDLEEVGRQFRAFAERMGNDLAALAAMQRTERRGGYDPARLTDVKLPVMVLIGDKDDLVGPADKLAAAIPGATLVKVPGDHLTAVAAPELKKAVVEFLARTSPTPAR